MTASVLILLLRVYDWTITHTVLIAIGALQAATAGAIIGTRFHQLNEVNRRITMSFVVEQVFVFAARIAGGLGAVSVEHTLRLELLLSSLYAWVITLAFDHRMLKPTIWCSTCAIASMVWPQAVYELLTLGPIGGMSWASWIWYRGARDDKAPDTDEPSATSE